MKLTKDFTIANFSKPYIIAELGSNHNGDMEVAKKMIVQAKEAGAHCVKFQSWSKDSIFARKKYEDNYFIADDYRGRTDYSLEEIVEEYSISETELLDMKSFAEEVGIDCSSTPFNFAEADFLVDELKSPFIKVASMDLNNLPFLEYLGKKNLPMIISTGLSELHEIDKAVRTIENVGNRQICILHCVSTYPPVDKDVNLNNITTLMNNFPDYPVGFSDHTIGFEIPLAAISKGACLIEKHFTLDKNMEGWDHKVSATREELKIISSGAERIVEALGSFRISATESSEKKTEFRRSVVLTRNMSAGEVISSTDIDFKRPGSGIKPELAEFIIGMSVNKDLAKDHILEKSDLL